MDDYGFEAMLQKKGVPWEKVRFGQVIQLDEHGSPYFKVSNTLAREVGGYHEVEFQAQDQDKVLVYHSYEFNHPAWVARGKL